MIEATSIEDVQQFVRSHDRVRVVAGGSKSALSAGANLSLAPLAGVLEYEPSEYTFTAHAGTKVSEIAAMLAERGQYLPFDPLLADAGATLGGTVAAATSGPGRLRYGGVRDFLLGTRFVNGEADVVFGGGKVVKNAAGFDLPKLMVGALGELGVLCELTFKVFPQPEATASLSLETSDLKSAVQTVSRLARSPLDLCALELEPPTRLWLQIAGIGAALPERVNRIRSFLGDDCEVTEVGTNSWRRFVEFEWVPVDHLIVRAPISLGDIEAWEHELSDLEQYVPRRYSVAGNLAYLAWPQSLGRESLHTVLLRLARSGTILRGADESPRVGRSLHNPFGDRLRSVLDPHGKF